MEHEFIKTENHLRCFEVLEELDRLPDHSHKMALFYGKFGLGKSISIKKLANDRDAALVRTLGTWTPKSMLQDICFELGLDETGVSSALQKRIIDELIENPRPIIIDEVDTIQTSQHKTLLLIIRDIHDLASVPIVFTGMEECIKRFKRDAHYFSRFVKTVKIVPNTKSDIAKYCKSAEIDISDELINYFHMKYANLRQIKTLIIRLEEYCENNDYDEATLDILQASNIEKQHDI